MVFRDVRRTTLDAADQLVDGLPACGVIRVFRRPLGHAHQDLDLVRLLRQRLGQLDRAGPDDAGLVRVISKLPRTLYVLPLFLLFSRFGG